MTGKAMPDAIDHTPVTPMGTVFRPGRTYTLIELAELARRNLEHRGLTQQQAADFLNEHATPQRGKYHRVQVGAALSQPEKNPGMVMLLIEMFTDYAVRTPARYLLDRKESPT